MMQLMFRYIGVGLVVLGISAPALIMGGWVGHAVAAEQSAPKQIALTQTQIDNVIAAQKDVRAAEGNQDKPDPASEAKVAAALKKHGFTSIAEYSDVSFSIGLVMAGYDPEAKSYVGPTAVIKKQIEEVQADTKMPPKEKKEALAELNQALKQGPSEKPLPANIDMIKTNFDKLAQSMQQSD